MRLSALLLALFFASVSRAIIATATVTFDHDPQEAGVEYAVEARQGSNWVLVATGPKSPVVWKGDFPFGLYTVRVRAVLTAVSPPLAMEPSAEASTIVGPRIPTNPGIKVDRTVAVVQLPPSPSKTGDTYSTFNNWLERERAKEKVLLVLK
jgi:hypothetical protein